METGGGGRKSLGTTGLNTCHCNVVLSTGITTFECCRLCSVEGNYSNPDQGPCLQHVSLRSQTSCRKRKANCFLCYVRWKHLNQMIWRLG
jgi:hypothetical protein